MSVLVLLILCGFARALGEWDDAVSTYSTLLRRLFSPVLFLTACAIGLRGRVSENWVVIAGLAVLLLVGFKSQPSHRNWRKKWLEA